MVILNSKTSRRLTNHEIVTLAVYMLGGEFRPIDTEEIAVKANALAPGRFTWRNYRDQINIENVRAFLSDAKKPKNGAYLIGAGKEGWFLTEQGVLFAKQHLTRLPRSEESKKTLSPKDKAWLRRERERMLATDAFAKFERGSADEVSQQEAEAFFRIDSYISEKAREQKLARAKSLFADDPQIGPVIKKLEPKVRRTSNANSK